MHLVQATTEMHCMVGCCVFEWKFQFEQLWMLWITDKRIRVSVTCCKYITHTHTHQTEQSNMICKRDVQYVDECFVYSQGNSWFDVCSASLNTLM